MKLFKLFFTKISINIFGFRLPIKYVLFNYLYKIFVIKNNVPQELKSFDEDGYCKLDVNLKTEIEFLMKDIKLSKKDKKGRQEFELDENKKRQIYNILKRKLNKNLINFEKYFNLPINLASLKLFRIENELNDNYDLKDEFYSRNFHNDSYVMNYFKIFINLQDINNHDGPTNFISKKNNKKFINLARYYNRDNYNEKKANHLIKKNIGKIGDCFAMSTTLCFHRASVPTGKRDMMILTLVALPKINNNEVNFNNAYIRMAKPYNFFQISKLGMNCFKKKLS
mgnify:CR=1 FL=1|tara:strand:+ start:11212 stop:12057 length:846 start_codon:yes stop_codon:yes gene_type:complete